MVAAATAVVANTAEVAAWVNARKDDILRGIFKEMKKTAVKLLNAAMKRVPVSARVRKGKGASRGGGANLKGSLTMGFIRIGTVIVGWVGTPVTYAQYTEIPGRNRRINVGTPLSPTTSWAAKSARLGASGLVKGGAKGRGRVEGQSMPWLHSAWYIDVEPDHLIRMMEV